MTTNQTRDKLRAVFLAALMVFSVFAGTMAFAGTAAANVTSLSVAGNSDPVQSDGTIWVSGQASNTDDITLTVGDGSNTDTVTKSISSTDFSVSIDLSNLGYTPSEGLVTIEAVQDSSDTAATAQFEVDDTAPAVPSFSASQVNGQDVKVELTTDEQLGSADADLGVDVTLDGGSFATLARSDFSETDNGDGSFTYTATVTGGVDGSYEATLTAAKDAAGNDGSSSNTDSVTIEEGPDFANPSPNATTTSDNETKITLDIADSDDGVDKSTITVTLVNESGDIVSTHTVSDSGVYFSEGTLSVYPGSGDVPQLPDGTVTINVDAADTNGYYNSTSFWFTVDTVGPKFSNEQPSGDYIIDSEGTFSVDIDDVSGVDQRSPTVKIVDGDGNVVLAETGDTADSVSFDGDTLTVDPSASSWELPEGEVNYIVSADDDLGNPNSSTLTYTVDTTQPTVESATLSDTPVNVSDATIDREVTIEFSEPMDNSDVPNVDTQIDGTSIVDSLSANTSFGDAGFGPSNTTWKGTVTLMDTGDDATAEIVVTGNAYDNAGLSINTSENNDTFVYDTVSPGVATNFSTDENLNGTVNVTQMFDVTNDADDVDSTTYEYSTDGTEFTEITSPESFDTTALDEGRITLKATVEDDVGNSASASDTVIVDNVDPAVTSNLNEGEKVYGTLNLTDSFDLTDDESVTYEYNDSGSGWVTIDQSTSTDIYNAETNEINTTELSDSTNGTLGLRVTVEDITSETSTTTVNVSVNNIDIQDFAFEGTEGESSANVSFASNAELSDVDIVVSQRDSYFSSVEDVNLTVDDFSESYNETSDTYNYTATVELPHDGGYTADFNSANATDGQKLVDSSISADANVDAEDPHVTDAVIIDADDTSTTVRVEFNEPIVDDLSGSEVLEVGDARAQSANIAGGNAKKGYVEVTFDSHFQTGNSPELNVSDGAFNEKFHIETQNATSSDDTTVVHTLELNLEEGHNVVSVPAASGGLDLTELDALSENDTVWAYDDGEWLSYTPGDNQSDFTTLEGGQGYIFVMNSSATIDVNVYNQPGGSDVGSSTPGSEDVNEGWNLLGHWQEGSQTVSDGLSTIGSSDYSAVYKQTQNGELSFSVASNMDPGEGYWVFVTEDDGDAYGEHAYAN